jgi:hypothetical protein
VTKEVIQGYKLKFDGNLRVKWMRTVEEISSTINQRTVGHFTQLYVTLFNKQPSKGFNINLKADILPKA